MSRPEHTSYLKNISANDRVGLKKRQFVSNHRNVPEAELGSLLIACFSVPRCKCGGALHIFCVLATVAVREPDIG